MLSNEHSINIENSNNSKPKEVIVCQFILAFMFIVSLAFLNNYDVFFKADVVCFYDHVHEILFNSLNLFLANNPDFKNALIIIGSLLIDITVIFTGVYFAIYGNSWVWLSSLVMFYGSRMIVQLLYLMRFPERELFTYPGFPSLFVSYYNTNDFFYSGHVGISIICGYELKRIRVWMFYIGVGISLYECFVMAATRGHYSIDLLFGYVMCLYSIVMCRMLCKYLDKWVYIGNTTYEEAQAQQKIKEN